VRIANVTDTWSGAWRFLADRLPASPQHHWTFLPDHRPNLLERLIRRPSLQRLGACWHAARLGRTGRADVVISHIPLTTAWTEAFWGRRRRAYHIAHTFNFTNLPEGASVDFFRRHLSRVDRFVVFSQYEREAYAELFGLDRSRIDMVHWSVGEPFVEPVAPLIQGDYVCAVGGEGRDYRTLAEAARQLPQVRFVFVCRPRNVEGIDLPANVECRTNLPLGQANNILKHAQVAVVPLLTDRTACGHVTLVSAMYLERPQVVTRSRGVEDYVVEGRTGLFCPVGDAGAMASSIASLLADPDLRRRIGAAGREFALTHCTEAHLVAYYERLLADIDRSRR